MTPAIFVRVGRDGTDFDVWVRVPHPSRVLCG
jgi:hypothetical protein